MLFQIEYTTRNEKTHTSEFVDFVPDKTEAVKRFMGRFFEAHPGDAVRIDLIREVEVIGDGSLIGP